MKNKQKVKRKVKELMRWDYELNWRDSIHSQNWVSMDLLKEFFASGLFKTK